MRVRRTGEGIPLSFVLLGLNNPASQPSSGVSCRLGPVVVRTFVDDHRFPDDIRNPEPVGEESHTGISAVGEKDGEIAGMIAMGLIIRIPVLSGSLKGICRVSRGAVPSFMDVEAVGSYLRPSFGCRAIGGQA